MSLDGVKFRSELRELEKLLVPLIGDGYTKTVQALAVFMNGHRHEVTDFDMTQVVYFEPRRDAHVVDLRGFFERCYALTDRPTLLLRLVTEGMHRLVLEQNVTRAPDDKWETFIKEIE